ncbi:hypothetical protein, partial [Armatimonas sp.]|uniref:hypothetical protein n=1 Tax=Armatimonas sp. TaxID=1872638 RepID=UPI00286C7501
SNLSLICCTISWELGVMTVSWRYFCGTDIMPETAPPTPSTKMSHTQLISKTYSVQIFIESLQNKK